MSNKKKNVSNVGVITNIFPPSYTRRGKIQWLYTLYYIASMTIGGWENIGPCKRFVLHYQTHDINIYRNGPSKSRVLFSMG